MNRIWNSAVLPGFLIVLGFFLLTGCPKKVETAKETVNVGKERPGPATERVEPSITAPSIQEAEVPRASGKEVPMVIGMGDSFFDFDKALVREDAKTILRENANWLRSNPNVKVQIEGHCDERGTTEYNLALGERRAQATKRFLVAMGVDSSRISTISYGEERPFCMGTDENCYQKNRRAHFVVK
ncbi:MAG TPA: peptidoglycan-associated lipoprotein Pal [Nitrospiria bacterium]